MTEQNCYRDGTVFEGVRSKDSIIQTWHLVVGEKYPGHAVVNGPSFNLDCFLTASDLGPEDYKQRMADLNLIARAPSLYMVLEEAQQQFANMAVADWRTWGEEGSQERFEEWVKSWARYMVAQIKTELAKVKGENNE